MFSDNLSDRVLQLLNSENLSYETAAELCGMSPRHFGNIIRRRTVPSIAMLEKMCSGFSTTPNDLLLPEALERKQLPLKVTAIRVIYDSNGCSCYPVCPGCKVTLEREYQSFCDRCGQRLDWSAIDSAVLLLPDRG